MFPPRRFCCGVIGFALVASRGLISLILAGGSGAAAAEPQAKSSDAPAELVTDAAANKALAHAAADVVGELDALVQADEPLTPEFVTLQVIWVRRQARPEIAAAPDARRRLEAAQRYRDRMKGLSAIPGFVTHFKQARETVALLEDTLREAESCVKRADAGEADVAPGQDPRIDASVPGPSAGDALKSQQVDEAKATAAARDAAGESAGLLARLHADEPLTPEFVERMCESSRKLCAAEVAAEPVQPFRVKALRNHLARMTSFHSILEARFKAGLDVSRVQMAQVSYFVREAETWLARAREKQPAAGLN
jgi:hypothetical protein